MTKLDGKRLLQIARAAISEKFGKAEVPKRAEAWLLEPGATFVTLTMEGELRGCIGSIEAHRPLGDDIVENAVAAAFRDYRFPSLREEEFPKVRIEVSLLSPLTEIKFESESHALSILRPHHDGVVFEADGRRSTFLPQVWAKLPELSLFMGELKRKAGFEADFWNTDVRLWKYTLDKWSEEA